MQLVNAGFLPHLTSSLLVCSESSSILPIRLHLKQHSGQVMHIDYKNAYDLPEFSGK